MSIMFNSEVAIVDGMKILFPFSDKYNSVKMRTLARLEAATKGSVLTYGEALELYKKVLKKA